MVLNNYNVRRLPKHISKILDGIFISDEIGYEKPQIEFFNYVFDRIPTKNPDEVIIIGDSLTSDIAGGIRAGIHTCWYHPSNEESNSDINQSLQLHLILHSKNY